MPALEFHAKELFQLADLAAVKTELSGFAVRGFGESARFGDAAEIVQPVERQAAFGEEYRILIHRNKYPAFLALFDQATLGDPWFVEKKKKKSADEGAAKPSGRGVKPNAVSELNLGDNLIARLADAASDVMGRETK